MPTGIKTSANTQTIMTALLTNTDLAPGCTAVRVPGSSASVASLQANVGWALAGNVVFAACQWGMLIVLARLGNSRVVGQFALGLAIATPVITLANLQLRSVQATDAKNRYSFADYFRLRRKTTLLGMLTILAIVFASGLRTATALVVIAVGMAKAVESLSDIYYGQFQNRERLGSIAQSMALRGTLGLAALGATLYFTGAASWAVAALVLAWMTVLLGFDRKRSRNLPDDIAAPHDGSLRFFKTSDLSLARTAFPLGIVTALMSLQMNMPRYFVQWHAGEATLGIFSAIAYLGTLLTVLTDSIGLAATPRMAKYFTTGQLHELRRLLVRLTAVGGGAAVMAIVVAAVAGALVLRLAYGAEYAPYRGLFVWLMLATGVGCVGTLLCSALTAGGHFRQQIVVYGAAVTVAAVSCALLTPKYGAQGAALAMILAATVHVLLSAVFLSRMLRSAAGPVLPGSPGPRVML